MTWKDLVLRVETFYPKLASAKQEILAAKGKAREKRGAFDPVLTFGSDLLRYNSSSAPGKAYSASQNEGIVELTTPSGLKFFGGVRLNQGQVKSPASSTGDLGEYFGGVKMPLLRGNGVNEKGVAEAQAKLNIEVAEQAVATFRLVVLRDGSVAYWDWVAASERLTISRNLLTIATVRANAIRQRAEAGDIPKIDLIEAETEVKRREGALVKSERDLQKASLKLSLYVWDINGPVDHSTHVPPPITQTQMPTLGIDGNALQEKAVVNRPELKSFIPVEETLALSKDLAKNDRKPSLDLGVGPGLDTGAGSIGPTWKLSLFYSVPLRQNSVDGRLEEIDSKLKKLQLDRTLAVQQVKIEVVDALSAVSAAEDRIAIAREELELAKRLEEGERARFELGEGTLFLLNQRERSTAETASRLVDVIAEWQVARIALLAATGEL